MPADREWPDAAAVEAAIAKFRARRSLRGATDLKAREDMREILRAAVEASPVVPVPPCPTCKGSGTLGYNARIGEDEACAACNGWGRDRLIPESELRTWVDEFTAWLDARGER